VSFYTVENYFFFFPVLSLTGCRISYIFQWSNRFFRRFSLVLCSLKILSGFLIFGTVFASRVFYFKWFICDDKYWVCIIGLTVRLRVEL